MQNMKWAVEIQKSGLGRRNLGDLLTGLGFQLVDSIEFDVFTSPSLDRYDTAGEVWSEAKRLREAFTGPAEIDPGFTLGSVIDYSTDPPQASRIFGARADSNDDVSWQTNVNCFASTWPLQGSTG